MISLEFFDEIYFHRDIVDMRKSINGLSSLVLESLDLDMTEKRLFVFINRNGRLLKMLYWDKSGFALWQKRLEKTRFHWPKDKDDEAILVSTERLKGFLSGYNVFQKPHEILKYNRIG